MLRSKDNPQKLGLFFHCGFLKSSSYQTFVAGSFSPMSHHHSLHILLIRMCIKHLKIILKLKVDKKALGCLSCGRKHRNQVCERKRALQGHASLVSAPRQISWELAVAVCENSGKSQPHRKEWVTWSQLGSRTKSYVGLRIPLKFTCQEEGKRLLEGAECVWITHPNTPASSVPN